MNDEELYNAAETLDFAADSECNETGEWWKALAAMVPRVFDCASKSFRNAYEREVKRQIKLMESLENEVSQ